jgi:hypothetical protein
MIRSNWCTSELCFSTSVRYVRALLLLAYKNPQIFIWSWHETTIAACSQWISWSLDLLPLQCVGFVWHATKATKTWEDPCKGMDAIVSLWIFAQDASFHPCILFSSIRCICIKLFLWPNFVVGSGTTRNPTKVWDKMRDWNNESWVHVIWSKEVGQRQLLYLVLSWSWELDCLNIPWRIFH